MGLFGFGRKHHRQGDDATDDATDDAVTDDALDKAKTAAGRAQDDADVQPVDEPSFPEEPQANYEHRGEQYGPWDVNDDQVPDYDEYLDLGAFYLPFMQHIELRIKADRATRAVLGCTISYGSSSLEIEAFAAPKTMGLWDDARADLLASDPNASEHPGAFGTEVRLPVKVKGGTVATRIVGVDGPRWMLRGIFSGTAATASPVDEETKALDGFFAGIVVERGEEPLAPRDLIPMHAPVTPAQREAEAKKENTDGDDGSDAAVIPDRPTGPFDSDQQTEVKTTLSRGPMFSEVR